MYKEIQKHEPKIFQTFNRRLHKIIRIDKNGVEHIERETIWEDCDNDIDKELGLTKQIKQRKIKAKEFFKHDKID